MAYDLTQFQQLPELKNLTDLNQLSNYQDALNSYSFLDASKLGSDPFSKAVLGQSYDFGDRRAISNTALDYYRNLAQSAADANLGYYGINQVGALPENLFNATRSGWNLPVLNFGTAEGLSDKRFVPYELATKFNINPTTGNIQNISEFVSDDFFKNGSLVRLGDQYKDLFGNTDWMGTQYNFADPTLGFMFDTAQLNDLYAKYGAAGPTGFMGVDAAPQMQKASNYWYATMLPGMIGTGDVTGLAGQNIMRMTPELRAQLLAATGGTENLFAGNIWGDDGYLYDQSNLQNYKNLINNAELYGFNKDANTFVFGDTSDPSGFKWTADPYFLTEAGRDQLRGEQVVAAQHAASMNSGWDLGNIISSLAPTVIGSLIAGPVLGLSGIGAGAVRGAISSAMRDGDILSGAVTGGVGAAAGELTGGLNDLIGGAEWFTGLSPEVKDIILSAGGGAVTGGLGSALQGGDILEGALAGGMGGAAGKVVHEYMPTWLGEKGLDLGLSKGVTDILTNVSESTANNMAKDFVLTGGENVAGILKNAGYNIAGNLAAGATYDALKRTPEVKDGAYIIDGVAYKDDPATGSPTAVGWQDSKTGDITSFSEHATRVGAENPYSALDYIDNKDIRKYSMAAGMGVAEYLKTGNVESALLSALPYVAQGAVDQLFDALGVDTRWDEGGIANKLVSMGVAGAKAKTLAESVTNARRSAIAQGLKDEGVSPRDAEAASKAKSPEERRALIARRGKAKPQRGVLAGAQRLLETGDASRGNALAFQQPTAEEEQASENKDILDPALADAIAELEAMGVEYAEA